MLLAHKYEILSSLLKYYNLQSDLTLKFSRENLEKKIGKENANILLGKDDTIIKSEKQLIIIDAKSWLHLFVQELNKLLCAKGDNLSCRVSSDYKNIEFFNNEKIMKEFKVNFDPNYFKDYTEETINFCEILSFTYNIYWLDLINNINTFDMFYEYLVEHFNKLALQVNPRISIENLSSDEKRQLYQISIKKYLNEKYHLTEDIGATESNLIRNYIREDNIYICKVNMNGQDIFIIQTRDTIEFIGFKKTKLNINNVNKREINNLKDSIQEKIVELDKLTFLTKHNFFRDIQGFYKILSTLSILSTPLAALLLIFNINIKILNISILIVISLTYYFIFKMIIAPQLKISKFSWDIKKK